MNADCERPVFNQHSAISNSIHSGWHNFHKPGLFFAKAQVVAAEAEFNWVAQRRPSDDLNTSAIAEAHLEQPAAEIGVASDGKHAPLAPDAQPVQPARLGR